MHNGSVEVSVLARSAARCPSREVLQELEELCDECTRPVDSTRRLHRLDRELHVLLDLLRIAHAISDANDNGAGESEKIQ